MLNRERLLLIAPVWGIVPIGLALLATRAGADSAIGTLLHIALWGALLVPVVIVGNALLIGGAGAFVDLLVATIAFGIAGAILRSTPYGIVRVVYHALPAIGLLGSAGLVIAVRLHDRRARIVATRDQAMRELRRLHWRLFVKPAEVTDAEIDAVLMEYLAGLPADPRARAAAVLGAIAPVCERRPERTDDLLERFAQPPAAAGFADTDAFLEWIRTAVADDPALETDEAGRRWLRSVDSKSKLLL